MPKEGQVAMDFTGERGKVITDVKEIQQLANTRNNVVSIKIHSRQLSHRNQFCIGGRIFEGRRMGTARVMELSHASFSLFIFS